MQQHPVALVVGNRVLTRGIWVVLDGEWDGFSNWDTMQCNLHVIHTARSYFYRNRLFSQGLSGGLREMTISRAKMVVQMFLSGWDGDEMPFDFETVNWEELAAKWSIELADYIRQHQGPNRICDKHNIHDFCSVRKGW